MATSMPRYVPATESGQTRNMVGRTHPCIRSRTTQTLISSNCLWYPINSLECINQNKWNLCTSYGITSKASECISGLAFSDKNPTGCLNASVWRGVGIKTRRPVPASYWGQLLYSSESESVWRPFLKWYRGTPGHMSRIQAEYHSN